MKIKDINISRLQGVLVLLARLIVGVTFIASGFAKAVDPWGTVYKFADYIGILGMSSLEPLITFGAFALPLVEFLLGVFVLFGLYRRMAPMALAALMLVLTPLTFYLAVTDRMADCGCFGDVVVLSNWATFFKNLVLCVPIGYLVLRNRRIDCLYGPGVQWLVWAASMAFVLTIEYWGYTTQPLIDFRSFKVGEAMYVGPQSDVDADEEFVFVYTKNGVTREFTVDSLPDDDWEFVERRVANLEPIDYAALRSGVVILDEGIDRTAELLDPDGEQLIFVFSDLSKISISATYIINELNEFANRRGVSTFGVAMDEPAAIERWNDISMAQYPMYEMDDTEMKMLVRGNPGLIYLKDGKVVWKRALGAISPELMQNSEATMMSIVADFDEHKALNYSVGAYLLALIVILLINRTHKVVKFSTERIKKNHKKDVTLQEENEGTNN